MTIEEVHDRIHDEIVELSKKIDNLKHFKSSIQARNLPMTYHMLLNAQASAMEAYLDILRVRSGFLLMGASREEPWRG